MYNQFDTGAGSRTPGNACIPVEGRLPGTPLMDREVEKRLHGNAE